MSLGRARALDRRHDPFDMPGRLLVGPVVREVQLGTAAPCRFHALAHAILAERASGDVGSPRLAHVDLAGFPHDLAQFGDLIGVAPRSRVIAPAGGEADRTLLEPVADQALCHLERLAPQRLVVESERLQPHGRVRHEVGRIDRNLPVIVAAEGGDAAHVEMLGRISQETAEPVAIGLEVVARERRVRHAVDAEELGGDALPDAVGVLRVDQQRTLGMGVGVDEARRHGKTLGIDHARGFRPGQIADRLDPFALEADIAAIAGAAAAVDDRSTDYNHVKHE